MLFLAEKNNVRILFDAGHGGDKPGAVYEGVVEKDINLAVVLAAGKMLRDYGHQVLFTRDHDTSLPNIMRRDMVNKFQPDLFVSVHCNASEKHRSSGVEAFYRDDRDYPLANMVQQAIAAYTGMIDRGIFQDVGDLKKQLTVLDNSAKTPSTLVEIGFLDNDENRMYITKNIATIAEALVDGILTYADQRRKA